MKTVQSRQLHLYNLCLTAYAWMTFSGITQMAHLEQTKQAMISLQEMAEF